MKKHLARDTNVIYTSKEVWSLNYPATCQYLSIATELWKLGRGTQKI